MHSSVKAHENSEECREVVSSLAAMTYNEHASDIVVPWHDWRSGCDYC
jgi:hypothetical protein